jgi:hypothetical protein
LVGEDGEYVNEVARAWMAVTVIVLVAVAVSDAESPTVSMTV